MGWLPYLTHRQFRLWQSWQKYLWKNPNTDLLTAYLMNAAMEARRCWVKDPNKVRIDDVKLEVVEKARKKTLAEMTPFEAWQERRRLTRLKLGTLGMMLGPMQKAGEFLPPEEEADRGQEESSRPQQPGDGHGTVRRRH